MQDKNIVVVNTTFQKKKYCDLHVNILLDRSRCKQRSQFLNDKIDNNTVSDEKVYLRSGLSFLFI